MQISRLRLSHTSRNPNCWSSGAPSALIGLLLAVVYTLASFTQIIVGHLIDKVSLKRSQWFDAIGCGSVKGTF